MCDYCEKLTGDDIANNYGLSIWIEDHYPSGKVINAGFAVGDYDETVCCVINYCPMCGRSLADAKS